ncbi:MAG TPA: non-heme iron oxygenase ferredoxin subunit [Chloroflexota bacterium]|nr:non-heme iron oxygenase ferredoxin subunit [Chloroflexota bacterium]
MAEFQVVARLSDLPADGGTCVLVSGRRIALFRVGEAVYAIDDTCTHEDASLAEGTLYTDEDEPQVECPKHGAMFELATGQVLTLPAVKSVAAYETRLEGDDILIKLPAGAGASGGTGVG